jgi:hypothetical protein
VTDLSDEEILNYLTDGRVAEDCPHRAARDMQRIDYSSESWRTVEEALRYGERVSLSGMTREEIIARMRGA